MAAHHLLRTGGEWESHLNIRTDGPASSPTPCRFVRTRKPPSTGPVSQAKKKRGRSPGIPTASLPRTFNPCPPLFRTSCTCTHRMSSPFSDRMTAKAVDRGSFRQRDQAFEAKGAMGSKCGGSRLFDRFGRPRDHRLNFSTQQGMRYIRSRRVGKSSSLSPCRSRIISRLSCPRLQHGNPMRMPSRTHTVGSDRRWTKIIRTVY